MAGEAGEIFGEAMAVCSRLLDHRPATRAECKYLLKEFEFKRNDRELLRLRETIQKRDKIERLLCESNELSNIRLEQLQTALSSVNASCESVLSKDRSPDAVREDMKARRDTEMAQFRDDMGQMRAEVVQLNKDRLASLEKEPL